MDVLFFAIVSRGKANLVLRRAQESGAEGGTIVLGEGTIHSKLLERLGLAQIHKEIVLIPAKHDLSVKLHEMVRKDLGFSKKNKGIAFTIPFERRTLHREGSGGGSLPGRSEPTHFCITIIVDKGRGKDCMKVARTAGATGGTLLHGRGAGVPTDFYFPIVVEPQKDLVLIIAGQDKVSSIRDAVSSQLGLGKAGKGFIFVLPVLRTTGLFDDRAVETGGEAS